MPVLTDTQRHHPAYKMARKDYERFANPKTDPKENRRNFQRYLALFLTPNRFEEFQTQLAYLTDIANHEPHLGIIPGRPNLLMEILQAVMRHRCQGSINLFCQKRLFVDEQPSPSSITLDRPTQAALATVYETLPKPEDAGSGKLNRETAGQLIVQEIFSPLIREALPLTPALKERGNVPIKLTEQPANIDGLSLNMVIVDLQRCIVKKGLMGGATERTHAQEARDAVQYLQASSSSLLEKRNQLGLLLERYQAKRESKVGDYIKAITTAIHYLDNEIQKQWMKQSRTFNASGNQMLSAISKACRDTPPVVDLYDHLPNSQKGAEGQQNQSTYDVAEHETRRGDTGSRDHTEISSHDEEEEVYDNQRLVSVAADSPFFTRAWLETARTIIYEVDANHGPSTLRQICTLATKHSTNLDERFSKTMVEAYAKVVAACAKEGEVSERRYTDIFARLLKHPGLDGKINEASNLTKASYDEITLKIAKPVQSPSTSDLRGNPPK